jgi:hypothetical protein
MLAEPITGNTAIAIWIDTRWSKTERAGPKPRSSTLMDCWRMIHFHLDGLGNINDILDKTGDYSHNVTARVLRFVYRNLDTLPEFRAVLQGLYQGSEVRHG